MAGRVLLFLTTVFLHQWKAPDAVFTFLTIPLFAHSPIRKGTRPNALVTCSAKDDVGNDVTIEYYAPGRLDPLHTTNKYTVSIVPGKEAIGTLIVKDLMARDSGIYRCVALLSTNSLVNKSAEALLEVEAAPVNTTVELLPDRTILVGETFTVNCSVDEDVYPLPDIELMRSNELVQSVNGIQNVYVVGKASQADEGTYACTATNRVNSTASVFKTVTIEAPPAIDRFCPSSGVIYICTNQSKRLTCSATADPNPTVNISGETTTVGDVLFIPSVQLSDAGVYTCTAFNDHGSVNETCRLVLGVPPNPDRALNVAEGELVSLSCPSSGSPLDNVTWFVNREEKTEWRDQETVHFRAAVSDHGMTVCNISTECGHYSRVFRISVTVNDSLNLITACSSSSSCSLYAGCTVHLPYQQTINLLAEARSFPKIPSLVLFNPAGVQIANSSSSIAGPPMDAYRVTLNVSVNKVGRHTFHLGTTTLESVVEVTADRMIVSGPSSPVVLTKINPSQQLTCVARSYPCQPVIEWSQGGMQLPAVNHTSVGADGANISTAMLTVSKCNGLGEYQCVVVDSGEKRTVIVDAEPMFVNTSTVENHVVAAESSNVSLNCESTGCPAVIVIWSGPGPHGPIGNMPHPTLPNVEPKDSGQYTCEVTDNHGKIERHFQLDVTVEPEIVDFTSEEIDLSLDSSIDLFCDARGYPQSPTVVWHPLLSPPISNDGRSTNQSDGSLLTHSVLSVNRTGVYKCIISGTNKEQDISVVARLSITSVTPNQNLSASGSAKLVCVARAFPTRPTIVWRWNGTVIQQTLTNWNLSDNSFSTNSKIIVEAPGDYVCHAEAGQSDQPQQRTVSVGPGPPVEPPENPSATPSPITTNTTMEVKLEESSDDKGGLFGLKNPFDWVVLAAIVVFVFLILLIICLYCCRQHKKKGDKTDGGNIELTGERRIGDIYRDGGRGVTDTTYDDVNGIDEYGADGPTSSTFRPKTKTNLYVEPPIGGYEAVGEQNPHLTKAMQKVSQGSDTGYATVPDEEVEMEGPYAVANQRRASSGTRRSSTKRQESNLVITNTQSEPSEPYAVVNVSQKKRVRQQQATESGDQYPKVNSDRRRSQGKREEPMDSEDYRGRNESVGRRMSSGYRQMNDDHYPSRQQGSLRPQRQSSEGIQYADLEYNGDGSPCMHHRAHGEPTQYTDIMFPQEVIEAEL